jgi:predicted MFS family arabinose efflux permease
MALNLNPWRGLGALPREIWVLFVTTLVNRAGTMALPFLVLYLTRNRGFSAGEAGLALGVYGVGAMITAPISGALSDRIGSLFVMKGSLVFSAAFLFLFPFVPSYRGILLLTFLWAVANEAFRPAGLSATAEYVTPENRKTAMAVIRVAINLGMSVGPAVAGILATYSYSSLFFVDGGTSLLAACVLFLFQGRKKETSRKTEGRIFTWIGDPRLLYLLALFIPLELIFFQHEGSLPLFLVNELKMPEKFYGFLFPINTILIILLEVPLNLSMAHWPHRKTLILGALLIGTGFGALMLAHNFIGVALTVVIWTFGEMIFFPTSAALVADMAPEEKLGAYMGLYVLSFSFAFALGPWLGTVVLQHLGSTVLWGCTFGLGLLSALMAMGLSGAKEGRSHPAGATGID